MSYTDIADADLAVDKPFTYTRARQFRDNDAACAEKAFMLEFSVVQTSAGTYTQIKTYPIYIPESAKTLRLYGQMNVSAASNGYAKWKVVGETEESDAQSTSTVDPTWDDKTWTFSDISAHAGSVVTLELLAYNDSANNTRVKADASMQSRFART